MPTKADRVNHGPVFPTQLPTPHRESEHLALPSTQERVNAARQHLKTSIDWKGEVLGVLETRRHYGSYFKGFRDIKPYRMRLVTSMIPEELFQVLDEIETKYKEYNIL